MAHKIVYNVRRALMRLKRNLETKGFEVHLLYEQSTNGVDVWVKAIPTFEGFAGTSLEMLEAWQEAFGKDSGYIGKWTADSSLPVWHGSSITISTAFYYWYFMTTVPPEEYNEMYKQN